MYGRVMGKIKVIPLFSEAVASDSYLLLDTERRVDGYHAAVVDPSVSPDAFGHEYNDAVIEKVFLTHGHFDHTLFLDEYCRRYSPDVYIHKDDMRMLSDGTMNCSLMFLGKSVVHKEDCILTEDGSEITLFGEKLKVLHTPGHTKGSVCYLLGDIIFTGDTLFCGSVGRCDFPGGSSAELISSLQKLSGLSGDYRILPGHGEETTLANEKLNNCYMKGNI